VTAGDVSGTQKAVSPIHYARVARQWQRKGW
jgi:hypothetical protein